MIKAGRELNALVAEKVMGWQDVTDEEGGWGVPAGDQHLSLYGSPFTPIPPYSTDIAAAWKVVKCFTDVVIEKAGGNYRATVSAAFEADAPTAPHAICLAALRAMGMEI